MKYRFLVIFYITYSTIFAQTTQILIPQDDTYVSYYNPTTNYASSLKLSASFNVCGAQQYACNEDHSYVKFYINSLIDYTPPIYHINIISASLSIFCNNTNAVGTPIKIEKVTSEWQDNTVNYNSKPTSTYTSCCMGLLANGLNTFDVTSIVQDQFQGLSPNYGFDISQGLQDWMLVS
ncbi:MAG: DNRLRE domain-containing protein [Bacteroidia bacterium]|nr:DNRLRE domain-containing protein [Bacteroidia bacterium]